jgi:hypothetical protein
MFRKGIVVVLMALGMSSVVGCAWETGDEAVYYQHAPKHELDNGAINDPSGLGTTTNQAVAAPDPSSVAPVQAGSAPGVGATPNPEPEPQPWMTPPKQKLPPQSTNSRIP